MRNISSGPGLRRATDNVMAGGYTCILTNKPFGILYAGVTAEIAERILAHREGRGDN